MKFLRLLAWFPLLFFLFSCGKPDSASGGDGTRGRRAADAPEEAVSPAGQAGLLEPAGQAGQAGQASASSPLPPEALRALLRPAETPLWFEFSAADPANAAPEGPRHIRSPAEAEMVPFTPWPLAPHVAATLKTGEVLYFAVNRDSLLALVPVEGGDLGLYRAAGTAAAAYWESYTVGNLFLYGELPALFFYRDDNFAEPAAPPPDPPALILSTVAPFALFPLAIPALTEVPFAEGWEVDILRRGVDGLWYYRELRRINGGREVRYFRSSHLTRPGEEVGVEAYRGAQAPGVPAGEGETLPPLPGNFVYTHVNRLGNYVFAAWEEQEDYSIGAAGFMVIRGR
jgi:hypothetical protein